MEKLLEILEEINPDHDYTTAVRIIDDGLLDSLSVMMLVTELEDSFNVEISPVDMIPENFNTVEAMWNMIKRLQQKA